MADALFTQQRFMQFRGPSTSDEYNKRIEENHLDLTSLKNQTMITAEKVRESYIRILKDQEQIVRLLSSCEARVTALEKQENRTNFQNADRIDTARFDGTPFEIPQISRCYHNSLYGIVTLPKVDSSSYSRLTYQDVDGNVLLPSSLEARVLPNIASADNQDALIDSSDLNNAFLTKPGTIWERNVVVSSPHVSGARLTIYVKLPLDLFVNPNVNTIQINPFPVFGSNLVSISYTTKADVVLNETDGYIPLNTNALYANESSAVGHVPPGGWDGDVAYDYGPVLYHFDPLPITGMKIELQQLRFFNENAKYVYTYGLHNLDIRFDKFLTGGKTIVRFDAPKNKTITEVSDVIPEIYNVAPIDIADVFSWRTIWETSYNSGVYTINPVPNSKRVWIEVTLNQTPGLGTPSLHSINVNYS